MAKERVLYYDVIYEKAPEGGYVVSVPTLPGCHTQGETLEEARANVEEAILSYLESLEAEGEPIPPASESYHSTVEIPLSRLKA